MGCWICNSSSKCWTFELFQSYLQPVQPIFSSTVTQGKPFTPLSLLNTPCLLILIYSSICRAYSPAFKFYSSFRALLKFHLIHETFIQLPQPHPLEKFDISHNFQNNSDGLIEKQFFSSSQTSRQIQSRPLAQNNCFLQSRGHNGNFYSPVARRNLMVKNLNRIAKHGKYHIFCFLGLGFCFFFYSNPGVFK